MPFKMMTWLLQSFTHLGSVFTPEFGKKLTTTVRDIIMDRLDHMTEKDLKDVDKDEVTIMMNSMREFLMLSM